MRARKTEPSVNTDLADSDEGRPRSWRRFLIGPVLFLYMVGYMMSYYIVTEYTNHVWLDKELAAANISRGSYNITCHSNTSGPGYRAETGATATAARWTVYYSVAQGVPAIGANIVLGSYSDALGRKFLLVVATVGTAVRLCLSVVIIRFNANLMYFILVCAIEGCTGQFATMLQMAFAYISDITDVGRERTLGIVYIEVMLGCSLIAGSAVAGYLIDVFGFLVPMSLAAGCLVVSLAVSLVLLPESFPVDKRKKNRALLHVIKDSVVFYTRNDVENKRWKYRLLALAHAVCNLSFLSRVPTETLYEMATPFCWSAHKVGLYASIRTLCMVTLGFASLKVLRMRLSSISVAMVGSLSYGAGFLAMAFATGDTMLYVGLAVGLFGPLQTLMVRTVASSITDVREQGAMFASLSALEIASNLLSAVITGGVYSLTVGFMRGFVFLVMAGLDVIAALLLLWLNVGWRRERARSSGFDNPVAQK